MASKQYGAAVLAALGCLAGLAGRAQRLPVVPLVVVRPAVQLPGPAMLSMSPQEDARPAPTPYAPPRPGELPVYLVNGQVIISEKSLTKVAPRTIQKIEVYKEGNMPARWRSLASHGVINFTFGKMPAQLNPRPLASLRRQLKLTGPVRFELDGLPLQDTSLLIDKRAVAGLEVRPAGPGGEGAIVNIRVLRTGPDYTKYPPGTIFIRGTAGR